MRTKNRLEEELYSSEYADVHSASSSSLEETLCKISRIDDEDRKMLVFYSCMGKIHAEEEFIIAMNNLVLVVVGNNMLEYLINITYNF